MRSPIELVVGGPIRGGDAIYFPKVRKHTRTLMHWPHVHGKCDQGEAEWIYCFGVMQHGQSFKALVKYASVSAAEEAEVPFEHHSIQMKEDSVDQLVKVCTWLS